MGGARLARVQYTPTLLQVDELLGSIQPESKFEWQVYVMK